MHPFRKEVSSAGCLLFLIYINGLPKVINEKYVLFADDISIHTPCQNNANLNVKLNFILENTSNWMEEHNLQINYLKKNKLMTFHPKTKKTKERKS